MIGKIIVQFISVWVGWVFATYVRDLKHHGDTYGLEQVRSRTDTRREMPIAARKSVFKVGGYTLFAGQCGLLIATLAVRDSVVRSRLTFGSLACIVPLALAVNVLLPQFRRSDDRRLWLRNPANRALRASNVTDITNGRSWHSPAA